MKEQEKSPEVKPNKMEVRNLSNMEFRVMIIKIINSMKKDIETIKRTSHKEYNILNK